MERNSKTINKKFNEYLPPTIFMAVATNIAVILDSIIIGNFIGSNEMAAVNLFSPLTQLFFATTTLLGIGGTALVSAAKGQGDKKNANCSFSLAVFLLVVINAIFLFVLLFFREQICHLLTGDPELLPIVREYYIPFVLTGPLLITLISSTHYLRLENRPQFASGLVIIANACNLAFDIIFVKVFDLGVFGTSIATLVGYSIGFSLMLPHFLGKRSELRIDFAFFKEWKSFLERTGELLSIGLAGALGALLVVIKVQFLNMLVQRSGGNTAMVAYSVCSSSNIFISLFISGASQTMTTIAGVNIGSRDFASVRYTFKKAFGVLLAANIVILAAMLAVPEGIIGLFGVSGAEEVTCCIPALRINALSFPFLSLVFLLLYYYSTIRQKTLASFISIANGVVLLIPITWIMEKCMGINGIWWSNVAVQIATLAAIVPIIYSLRKKSKGRLKNFYLLEEKDEREIISYSFTLTTENASAVSPHFAKKLEENGLDSDRARIIAEISQTLAIDTINRRKNKKVYVDIRLLRDNQNYIIIFRDTGKPLDITVYDNIQNNPNLMIVMEKLKTITSQVEYSNVLGFNNLTIYFN